MAIYIYSRINKLDRRKLLKPNVHLYQNAFEAIADDHKPVPTPRIQKLIMES